MVHQRTTHPTRRKMYATGLIMMLVFGLGHIVYTFFAYQELNEPALWFFSGALTMLFATAINFIHLKVAGPTIYAVTMISNVILTVFSLLLALTLKEPQTIALSCVMIYVTCISFKTRDP